MTCRDPHHILKLDPGFEPATYGLVLAFQLQSTTTNLAIEGTYI